MSSKVNALVLAGAPNKGGLSTVSGAKYEAMVEINGKTILEYVLNGILQSSRIDKVVVVGPMEVADVIKKLDTNNRISLEECKDNIMENIMAGIECLPDDEYTVVFTSDIPFITGKDVDEFVDECMKEKADIYYPIISQETVEEEFPNAMRTYFTLKEGKFTAGNVFMVKPKLIKENEELIQKAFNLRKNPSGIASLLGAKVIMKFLAKTLSINDILERVQKSFGIKGKEIMSKSASIGMDVDKEEDFKLAQELL